MPAASNGKFTDYSAFGIIERDHEFMGTFFGGKAVEKSAVSVSDISALAVGAEGHDQVGAVPYIVGQATVTIAFPAAVSWIIAVQKSLTGNLLLGGIQAVPISNVGFS